MSRNRRRPRIGLAACFHETNTFASRRTDETSFRESRGWYVGPQLVDAYAGTRTVLGGVIDAAEDRGLELVPVFGAFATPAGLVTREAFQEITNQLVSGLEHAGPLDGLLLELHGAMVVEGDPDPETALLESVRDCVDEIPLVAVTDLHANMTPGRLEHLDALVGYRTNPHVDTYERGTDAARHLHRLVTGGLETTLVHRSVPVLAAPITQRTAELPLSRLLATARELERRHRLVDVTVHAGYAYADVPHAGLSFTVTSPVEAVASAHESLELLVRQAWELREKFTVSLPDAEEAVRQAVVRFEQNGGPVAIADTGDNINGGGPGDTTWLLRAALEQGAAPIAATVWDPVAVRAAHSVGVGASLDVDLGGRAEVLSGLPLRANAAVKWLGEGSFVNTGPMASGAHINMGATAVLAFGGADVIVQSLPVQPNDPEMFRSVNLDPATYALVLLKGAAALRAGWEPITSIFVDAGTPGVTDCDLSRLPYGELREVWPLTPVTVPPTHEERTG